MRTIRIALLLSASCSLAACGSREIPGFNQHSGPNVVIVAPHDGDQIDSSSVWLDLKTNGVTLAQSSDAQSGARVHVYLDGNAIGETSASSFLVPEMGPGAHTITARLFGVDGAPIAGAGTSQVSLQIPPDAPQLKIASPGNGAIVNSSSVELTLSWKNYDSDSWDAFVDSMDAPVAAHGEGPTWVVSRLDPGDHDIYVRLLWGPGDPVDPPVLDRIRVHIPEDSPGVRITEPLEDATVPRSPTLTVTTRNFTIDGNSAGGANQPGVGHYHVYLDGYDASHLWQEGYAPTITLDHLDVGEHDIYVRLMNNDHTSVDPKVVDWVHVTITPD